MKKAVNISLSPFALKLRELRLKKKLSLEEAASACHIAVKDLILYEIDKAVPSEATKRELLEFLQ